MKLNNQLGKKGRWVEAMNKAKTMLLPAESQRNNLSAKLAIEKGWDQNLHFLWNIETASKDEKTDKAIQLSPTQFQKLRKNNFEKF